MEDHDVIAASSGCYGEAARLVRRKFTACLNNFEMGEMGLDTRNFKFFWRRHDIWLFFVVELRFFCYWWRCNLDVWMIFGIFLRTRADVNPIHMA